MTDIYLLVENQEIGPFTDGDIKNMLKNRRITAETRCARPGYVTWVPVTQILGENRPTLPFVPTVTANPAPRRRFGIGAALGIVLLLAALLGVGSRIGWFPDNPRQVAYYAAVTEIHERFQSVTQITPFDKAQFQELGGEVKLAVYVTASNGFGVQIRRAVVLTMEKDGAGFRVLRVTEL